MSTPNQNLPSPFDWNLAYFQHRDCLPHLRQNNALYFITFRLNDSLPESHLKSLRRLRDLWLMDNPLPHTKAQTQQLRELWTVPIERLLDASHGTCVLRNPNCRQALETTMRHDDSKRYQLGDFVIMPNHVHVLVHVQNSDYLSTILQAWKSISARNINRLLHRRGTLWQPEPFDHIVRNQFHWQRFATYIKKNPTRLPPNTFTLNCGALPFPNRVTNKGAEGAAECGADAPVGRPPAEQPRE